MPGKARSCQPQPEPGRMGKGGRSGRGSSGSSRRSDGPGWRCMTSGGRPRAPPRRSPIARCAGPPGPGRGRGRRREDSGRISGHSDASRLWITEIYLRNAQGRVALKNQVSRSPDFSVVLEDQKKRREFIPRSRRHIRRGRRYRCSRGRSARTHREHRWRCSPGSTRQRSSWR